MHGAFENLFFLGFVGALIVKQGSKLLVLKAEIVCHPRDRKCGNDYGEMRKPEKIER